MTLLIILGCVVAVLIGLVLLRKPAVTEEVWYDEDEYEPPTPIQWGLGDYQPWPAVIETRDGWDVESEIETVTALWNGAMNDGDTIMAAALMDEYESLCRMRGQII